MWVFFLFQVHMQVIFSSDRGMKSVSLHNEAQVVPRFNYRNPVSRENIFNRCRFGELHVALQFSV